MSYKLTPQKFDAIENGNYNVEISDCKEISGDFPHFVMKLKITDDCKFKNRTVFHRLWFSSETPQLAEKLMNLSLQCFNIKIESDEVEASNFNGCNGNVALEQYSFTDKNGEDQINSRIARYNLV